MFQKPNKHKRLKQAASLRTARERGLAVGSVIDVGVQRGTSALIEVFPDKPHLLFEPVAEFLPDIARAYRHIDHDLFELALSEVRRAGFPPYRHLNGGGGPQ